MKRFISMIVCLALLLQAAPAVLAVESETDISASCVFDTYYENNQGKLKTYDKMATVLCGNVYNRYAVIKFDISAFAGRDFGGSVLSLYIRNTYDEADIYFYGSETESLDNASLLTAFQPDKKGKIKCEVAVTDYVKSAVESGRTELIFIVRSSADVTSIFSMESSDKEVRPALRICKEEPYIKGQIAFSYPVVTKETFKADIAETISGGHPYIFAKQEDFDRVRANLTTNKYISEIYSEIKKKAASYVGKAPTNVDQIINNQQYNARGAECVNVITNCAFVYLMEGDEAYAQRAYAEAEIFANLNSWGTVQYIDNNQPVQGLAICYDWLYDWLDGAQRDKLVRALQKNHFDTMYDMLTNPGSSKYATGFYRFYYNTNNHALLDNTSTFIGAMAIADVWLDKSAAVMQGTFENMKGVVENWYPDSAWYESLGYWTYTGPYMARWLVSMQKALGTTYGLGELECMKGIVDFPIYGASSQYVFVVNDTSYEMAKVNNSAYILATIKGDPALEKYTLENTEIYDPFTCLSVKTDVDYDAINASEFSLDKLFRNTDMVTMRNTWGGNQELFCGMFVQDARLTHGVMNSGTLVLEAFGNQWITNPGKDSYQLDGYWGSTQDGKRWQYYFSRAEANSCLVINPGLEGGHIVDSGDTIDKYVSKNKGSYAITDLTQTYKNYASSYRRGIMLTDERIKFVVQDEVELFKEQEVYSFINLNKCDIQIAEDQKSVILSNGNKKVKVNIICDTDYELSIMSADPLPTSPQMEGNRIVREIKRLAIHFPSVEKFNLRLEFTPYLTDEELTEASADIPPLDTWTIPDGELITVKADGMVLDGAAFSDFNPDNRCYTVETLPGTIECVADSAKYDISTRESDDGRAKYVLLKDKQTGRYSSYMFELPEVVKGPEVIDVSKYKEIKISKVTASADDGNKPQNTIDGSPDTRWSASGRQTITFELSEKTKVDYIAIAFYGGNNRSTYFDMEVSADNKNWTTVSVNDSCGTSTDFEYFDLAASEAKYVRYRGYGTSRDAWNSISEVKIYGK